ncbi:MAG: serine hydrolase [Planctomycetota bacterium]
MAALLTAVVILCIAALGAPAAAVDVGALMRAHPDRFGRYLENEDGLKLQVLLAEPVEDDRGRLVLRRSHVGDPERYFYPASTVKLCAAVAALLELNRINARRGTSLGMDTSMVIEPLFDDEQREEADPSNLEGGRITFGHEIRKLFIVSDNQAYNRLYEFLGHRELNEAMWSAGFRSCRIFHRLSEFRSVEDQRRTPALALWAGEHEVLRRPPRTSDLVMDNADRPGIRVGTAHQSGGRRIEEPFSFRFKNAVSLRDLQDMLAAVVRPDIDTGHRGFPGLTVEQRVFLLRAMSQLPRESANPRYDVESHPDGYVKFLLPGLARVVPAEHVRIYNKVGQAYGFSIENAYVEDARTGRCFFLAAVIYTNADGVVNDGAYEYAQLADPLFADLGEVVGRTCLLESP